MPKTSLATPHFTYADWILSEIQFNPEQLHSKETVFTMGNGYLGTRGSFEEGYLHASPATFIHGVYDDVPVVLLPLFLFTQPMIARNFLSYRWHTLPRARRKAAHYGYKGAMFAWESAVSGDEVTPRWALESNFYGEDVRIWCRDREIHNINADIPYGESGVGSRDKETRGQGDKGTKGITNAHFPLPITPYPQRGSHLPHSPNIKGFIFDLDGVLTDTAEVHYLAWKKLADEEGIPFNREANEALRGVSRRASLMLILGDRRYSEAQIEEMMERKNRYYVELIQNMTPKDLLPGAIALLDELRQAGIKIGIGSASKNAHTVIERLGIADKIDAIADGYSVEQPKPAPDLFLFAAKQLGIEPEQSVVVEDAAAGVEAALAAGMWAVGLGPVERVGAAHVVLPSLAGIKWAYLREQLIRNS